MIVVLWFIDFLLPAAERRKGLRAQICGFLSTISASGIFEPIASKFGTCHKCDMAIFVTDWTSG